MTAEAPGGELRGIGTRLRAAREKRGLTLLQAAERLHLDAGIVQALEAENFTALGADVYVRGHLRRYAEAVGESPTQLQQLYADSPHVARPDLTRIPRGQPEKSSSWLLLPAVLLVVGFAMAGLLWWLLTLPGEKAHALPARPTPAAAAAAADAAPGTEEPAFSAPAGTSAAPPSASPAATSTGTGPQARLDLSFSGASWVEISDVQGHRLLHGLIEAGSTRTLAGSAPLLVVLGNAAAVTLRVNGQAVLPGTLVRRDGSAHLMIDAAGRVSVAAPRLAHGD
jgi:cytoskeleton protein RodZ